MLWVPIRSALEGASNEYHNKCFHGEIRKKCQNVWLKKTRHIWNYDFGTVSGNNNWAKAQISLWAFTQSMIGFLYPSTVAINILSANIADRYGHSLFEYDIRTLFVLAYSLSPVLKRSREGLGRIGLTRMLIVAFTVQKVSFTHLKVYDVEIANNYNNYNNYYYIFCYYNSSKRTNFRCVVNVETEVSKRNDDDGDLANTDNDEARTERFLRSLNLCKKTGKHLALYFIDFETEKDDKRVLSSLAPCTIPEWHFDFIVECGHCLCYRLHIPKKNRHFIIRERFNKLIYDINTIIKCGTWQPVQFQFSLTFLKWNDVIFYRISELMLPTLIQRYDRNSFHVWSSSRTRD